jgi:hypothetical protein
MDNDISYFSYLSDDEIIQIALQLKIADLSYYCLYNSHFRDVVCNNNWFWKRKFLLDFGSPEYDQIDDWKALYKNYGSVYVFGTEFRGHDISSRKIPHFNVKYISAGGHIAAIDFTDDVWTFGRNFHGQLGLGDNETRSTPTKIFDFKCKTISVGHSHTVAIDLNNDIWINLKILS